jgi:hypothetical protein
MVLAPLDSEGTVMLPDRAPAALTVKVLGAATPPNVTVLIDSEADHPDPFTVIELPDGPLEGEKLAVRDNNTVTVKALAKV